MLEESQLNSKSFRVKDYNLSVTLDCGQAFRWEKEAQGWVGVVRNHWLCVSESPHSLKIRTTAEHPAWEQIARYFRLDETIDEITDAFPKDQHLQRAVRDYKGLRLLRQEPWECLASFILSSTKQIPHIQQIIRRLAQQFGTPLRTPKGAALSFGFPSPSRIAQVTEPELRALGMGYRAPFLKRAAEAIETGELPLQALADLTYLEAKEALQELPGVGPKIAACVLLFAFGHQEAFPIDVWVRRALRELYFTNQNPTDRELEAFSQSYFGPHSGYAQQYLFHYIRMRHKSKQGKQSQA